MSLSESESPTGDRAAIRNPRKQTALVKCHRLPAVDFDCGDDDLNQWFNAEVVIAERELLTQTYELLLPGQSVDDPPVALVSLCNDAIRLRDLLENEFNVPEGKRFQNWPAVKIARLAVARDYQRNGLGTEVINLIKHLFIGGNRTGCRFLTLDSSRKNEVIWFYWKNEFENLTRDYYSPDTQSMWFDLKRLLISPQSEDDAF